MLLLDSIECLAPAAQRQLVEELESGQDFGLIVSSEIEVAREVTETFMRARFSEEERHRRRLEKLLDVERRYMTDAGTD